jgi:MFS transporter, putative metabolite:H+ symporter
MLVPYNSMKPLMECSHEEDGEEFASCSMKEACSGEYKIRIGESSVENWISSFMLVCGNEGKEQILVYLLFAGALVGSLFMSALADKLGRKGILLLSVVVYCLICLKSVFTQQIVSFAIVVFGLGIFLATYFNVALCYLLEFLAVENRLSYASFLNLSFPIAGIIVSFLMNQLQNWKIVIIISGIFCMVLVCYFAYFTESPRYHLAKDQFEEARVALQKLAYCNKGRNYLFTFRNEEVELESSFQEADRIRENGVYNFSEICCRFSSMWPGIFCLIIIAFTCFFTFSGLHLHLRPIFSLPYYDHLFVSAIDVVVILLAATFGEKCGRLKAIGLPLLIASVGCIVIYFLFWLPDLIYAIVIICLREFALLSLSVCFVFVPESFPTRMRSVGVGVVHVFSCIALILAYFLMSFKRDLFFVFGIVGLIGKYFTCFIIFRDVFIKNGKGNCKQRIAGRC